MSNTKQRAPKRKSGSTRGTQLSSSTRPAEQYKALLVRRLPGSSYKVSTRGMNHTESSPLLSAMLTVEMALHRLAEMRPSMSIRLVFRDTQPGNSRVEPGNG